MKIRAKFEPAGAYKEITSDKPVKAGEILAEYGGELPYQIIIARINGRDEELDFMINSDAEVEFLDIREHSAFMAYQHTLSLIYLKAVSDVLGGVRVEMNNSLNKGLYTEIKTKEPVTEEQVREIEARMRSLMRQDVPVKKAVYSREDAIRLCEENGYNEKLKLLNSSEEIQEMMFYEIDGYRNFFYGLMAPSAGYIEYFELRKYRNGVLLRFPHPSVPDKMPEYIDEKNLYKAFGESKRWQKLMDVMYLPDLNRRINAGEAKELVLLSEALHEKKIAEIADAIASQGKRIILIAGPSSSGKTTFAKRLCIQLQVNGLKPLYLGTDDYFVERKDTPLDEDGKPNYEDLDSIDIELFNNNMNALLAGRDVDLPEFNFMTGSKEYGKRITRIDETQPIVIEGIHALNGALTEYIDDAQKYRIYISPFTQLNVDTHNRVPTTDARKLRRLVRDYKFRGHSAAQTIAQWPKVRKGEDKNIFPYSGEADVLFNSAMVYELSVLKKYAEPLLMEVQSDEPEYSEAVRMLEFIRFFDVIEEEKFIPNNSIIREFIGGSIFVE